MPDCPVLDILDIQRFKKEMSDLGQTRTLDNVRVTSVKLLIADSKRTFSYVRSGPKADTCRAAKQRQQDIDAPDATNLEGAEAADSP